MKIGNWLYHIRSLFAQGHNGKNTCVMIRFAFSLSTGRHTRMSKTFNQHVTWLRVVNSLWWAGFVGLNDVMFDSWCLGWLAVLSRCIRLPPPCPCGSLFFFFYDTWRTGSPSRLTRGPQLRALLAELVISIIDGKTEVPSFKNIFKSPLGEAVGRTTRF